MNLQELKQQTICQNLGIGSDKFSEIVSFIDFANVNKWYENDRFWVEGQPLLKNEEIGINLEGLKVFLGLFSKETRFYYGTDSDNEKSTKFMGAARYFFGDRKVFTKPVQKIKHYIGDIDPHCVTRLIKNDAHGSYITIPKSNFDVEITLDAIRLSSKYKTICLLSGDADFVPLLRALKSQGKKIILIKGGFIQESLKKASDIVINAQDIKQYIATKKQKPGQNGPVFANS